MRAFVACAFILLTIDTAAAQSLALRQLQRDEGQRFATDVATLTETCGVELTAEVDWSSFGDADYREGSSVGGYCGAPVSALRGICGDTLGREAVRTRLTGLVCAHGAGPSAQIDEDGVYRFTFSWDDTDAFRWHAQFMGDNL